MKKIIYSLIIISIFTFISCDVEIVKSKIGLKSININKTSLEINVGGKATLKTNVEPKNAFDTTVNWSSENVDIATVDANGVITALAVGKTNIIATSNFNTNLKEICIVTVMRTLESLNIRKELLLEEGVIQLIGTNVFPKDISDTTVTWASTDINIAAVNEKGEIRAKSKGKVKIIATSNINPNLSEICELTVYKSLNSLNIITSLTIEELETIKLVTNVFPKDASDTSVIWSSDDENVVTVDINGNVTGKAKGTAYIRAISKLNPDIFELCEVTVNYISVKSITSLPSVLEISKGKSQPLKANVIPPNAHNPSILWETSDEKTVTVKDGILTPIKSGTVTIKVSSVENPSFSSSCQVTVTSIADIISFKFDSLLNPGMLRSLELTNYNELNFGGTFEYIGTNILIPTFTITNGASIRVNGTTPISGVTPQDFTSPVNYEVTSADGKIKNTFRVALNFRNDTLIVNKDSLICRPNYRATDYWVDISTPDKTFTLHVIRLAINSLILADSMNGFTVKKIGLKAFYYASYLENIKFPNSLEIIESQAFESCYRANQELILPNNLKKIGSQAFYNCSKLYGNLNIPNSVNTLDSSAFKSTGFNGTLNIGSGITEIKEKTFAGTNFTGVLRIPENIVKIGPNAFYNSNSFTSITYKNGIDVDAEAFNGVTASKITTYN